MSDTGDHVTEICGQQFRVVKRGLDESEVADFISSLLEQNTDLQGRLQHLNSLRRLAEKVVIRAEDQAEKMRREAEERAQEKLLLAEQRATEILREAEEAAGTGKTGEDGTPGSALLEDN
jgi:cell division septum initiation protein DivIVA